MLKKINNFAFFSFFVALLCLNGGVIASAETTVVGFGDSITKGVGSSSGGYPPKLASLLNGNGKPSTVLNSGKSGERTTAGVGRIGGVLASTPTDIILIMEGTNDLYEGISVGTTRYNLESMINQSRAAGAVPVIATLTPNTKYPSFGPTIALVSNPMIVQLANDTGTPLADQYSAILPTWDSSTTEGLHPNDTGYWTISNTWYGVIGGMISGSGEISSGGADSGGGGGCFIATAAFGSPIEKHVEILCDFRDQYLLTNYLGKKFVTMYYKYSPPVADFISDHSSIKLLVRGLLYPLIGLSTLLLDFHISPKIILLFLLGSSLVFMFLARRHE